MTCWTTAGPVWPEPGWDEPEYMLTILGGGARECPFPFEDWWWIPMGMDRGRISVLGKHMCGGDERRYDSHYPGYPGLSWTEVPQPVKDAVDVYRARAALSA